mgnify:CR=1 FL=1
MKQDKRPGALSGLICGTGAFLIWGLCPIFWKVISHVPAIEAITHRIVWSFLFLLPVIYFQGNWGELVRVLKSLATLGRLLITTLLVASNWLIFVWAINHELILQTSLGYYINPLVNVLFGTLFLKERLRRPQALAVAIAGTGVFYLTWQYGAFPWIAIFLAVTFGSYALVRKILDLDPAVGLAVETLLLTFPGIVYLIWLEKSGTASFLHISGITDLFLIATALVTALPLLLFNIGARRLRLITLGFLQYIAPSTTFILAVFVYQEPLSLHQLVAFIFIWTALVIYTFDSIGSYRGEDPQAPER